MLRTLLAALLIASSAAASASTIIVIDSRSSSYKTGQKIDSESTITLKEGERLTVIGPDGASKTIRGKFSGKIVSSATTRDPKEALAALINTRSARTSSIGAVRSATSSTPLPDPWVVDISTSGQKCVRSNKPIMWWRPDASNTQKFTMQPTDKSWSGEFAIEAGESYVDLPVDSMITDQSNFTLDADDTRVAININVLDFDVDSDLVVASWLLEKGCSAQADALIRSLSR